MARLVTGAVLLVLLGPPRGWLALAPLLQVVDVPGHTLAGLIVAQKWFLMLVHANTRLGLGPLRHLLVTPLFHRVHHSMSPRHRDVNFGVCPSVWDRLFGTRCEAGGATLL